MADKQQKQYKVIPQEVIDRGELFDIDEWRKQRIAAALKYQEEREYGSQPPQGWDEYHPYWNCIATATSAFNPDKIASSNDLFYGNKNSREYHEKIGFRKLNDDEKSEYGDLFQDDTYHALLYTGDDDRGKLFTYGRGLPSEPIVHNGHYPFSGKITRYRFVGSPEEIDEINRYNQSILDKQSAEANKRSSKPKPIKVEHISVERKVPTTQEWLEQMIKKKERR